jgi:hypothetical protein
VLDIGNDPIKKYYKIIPSERSRATKCFLIAHIDEAGQDALTFTFLKVIMKRLLLSTLLSLACATSHAGDGSQGSEGSLVLSGVVVAGSMAPVLVAGSVVVVSVALMGDALEVVVEGSANASKTTLRLSGAAIKGTSLVAGQSLNVVATSTGHLLVASGQVLAFIPNEIGKSLLHHSSVQ